MQRYCAAKMVGWAPGNGTGFHKQRPFGGQWEWNWGQLARWTDAPSREDCSPDRNKLCRMLPIQSDCRGVSSSRLHCSSFIFSHTAQDVLQSASPCVTSATVAALRGHPHPARPEPRSGEDASQPPANAQLLGSFAPPRFARPWCQLVMNP